MRVSLPIAVLAFASLHAAAQTNLKEFDVASVKPNPSGGGGGSFNTSHGRLDATNVSLRALVRFAFGVRDDQVAGGPAWFDTQKYDVTAKADSSANDDELTLMTQTMLADRFKLKFHRDTKESPVFSLVAAKGGPKLTEHSGTEPGMIGMAPAGRGMTGRSYTKVTMPIFAAQLGRIVGRSVIDNTGLKGEYDFKLIYARDDTADQSIYAVLQQDLGLKLEAAKGPVEIIVVDSAEKASAN